MAARAASAQAALIAGRVPAGGGVIGVCVDAHLRHGLLAPGGVMQAPNKYTPVHIQLCPRL